MPSVVITGANRGLGLEFDRQYAAVLDRLTIDDAGRFFERDGPEAPW